MARIDKKKQRRNLIILGIGTIVCIFLIAGLFVFIKNLFFGTPKEVEKEKKESKVVALKKEDYAKYKVDETGNIPVMMYHGIHNMKNSDTEYTGGNVDVDGYQRTAEAFRNDLDFYYENGYRMVRLQDYVNGKINVEGGKTPLVLTFDDGLANNIQVTGLDEKGEIIIDPNSAVGILESYKKKYSDFNVTATFFVNAGLFNQPEYNEKIIKWLVEHGYDVGNHTYSHPDFTTIGAEESMSEVGYIYEELERIIPDKYVNIVALPFGSPYLFDHENIPHIQDATYNGKTYHTQTMLQVAWEADFSPFKSQFNPAFIKRIRAYDNNGTNFDIEMNFGVLETNRYISDGDPNTIVVPSSNKELLGNTYDKEVITY